MALPERCEPSNVCRRVCLGKVRTLDEIGQFKEDWSAVGRRQEALGTGPTKSDCWSCRVMDKTVGTGDSGLEHGEMRVCHFVCSPSGFHMGCLGRKASALLQLARNWLAKRTMEF